MGTVKYTGPVASFHCPTNAEIRSLKVHFSPKQLGSGDPSPENVREIVGWDGVVVHNDDGIVVPEEYQKVEWIESDGYQYLDTQIIPTNSLIIDCKIEIASNRTIGNEGILGSRQTSSGGRVYLVSFYGNAWHYGIDGDSMISSPYSVIRYMPIEVHAEFINKKSLLNVGNLTLYNGSTSYTGNEFSMYLFACNNFGTAARYCASRVYSMKIQKNNTLILNFIPCRRKSDNKPGMYDTVTQTFFTNQGTGEFICGPDVGQTIDYEFGVLGKNKFGSWATGYYSPSAGRWIAESQNVNCKPIRMKAGTIVTLSQINTGRDFSFEEWENCPSSTSDCTPENLLTRASNVTGATQTYTVQNDCWLTARVNIGVDSTAETFANAQVQLELGSTATAYEPYDPNHTVYGGWVDLITGEVVKKYSKNTVGINDVSRLKYMRYTNNQFGIGSRTPKRDKTLAESFFCETMPIKFDDNDTSTFPYVYLIEQDNYIYFMIMLGLLSDYPDFPYQGDSMSYIRQILIDYFEENNTNFTFSNIAAPTTYHLAPTQLQTFLGQNNVWSNADYVEVEYDLHETQDILARKQFIMANQPHIVTPAAAPLQNFVTDVPAPLKGCKVYFNPVQEGTGDPSPTNVRPISGWSGCTVSRTGKNLLNEAFLSDINNYPVVGAYEYRYTNPIFLTPNTKYRITFTDSIRYETVRYWAIKMYNDEYDTYDKSGAIAYLINGTYRVNTIITTGSSGVVRFAVYGGQSTLDDIWNNTNVQMELGETATLYEPYSGTTIPIDWTTEAGTVYGGYVDLVNGELIETYKKYNLGDLSAITYGAASYDGDSGTNVMYYITNTGTGIGYPDGIEPIGDKIVCSGKNISGYYIGTWSNPDNYIWQFCINANNQLHVVFDNTTVGITSDMTFAQRREKITEWLQSNLISIVVPRQTPIVHTLTPTQLKTLRGTNNIWSNANGNIDLSYWKH